MSCIPHPAALFPLLLRVFCTARWQRLVWSTDALVHRCTRNKSHAQDGFRSRCHAVDIQRTYLTCWRLCALTDTEVRPSARYAGTCHTAATSTQTFPSVPGSLLRLGNSLVVVDTRDRQTATLRTSAIIGSHHHHHHHQHHRHRRPRSRHLLPSPHHHPPNRRATTAAAVNHPRPGLPAASVQSHRGRNLNPCSSKTNSP